MLIKLTNSSTIVMFAFYKHVDAYGPLSHGARRRREVTAKPETAQQSDPRPSNSV